MNKHEYLGDGVYVEFADGQFILRTMDHRDGFCDQKIYLECAVIGSLVRFVNRTKDNAKQGSLQTGETQ